MNAVPPGYTYSCKWAFPLTSEGIGNTATLIKLLGKNFKVLVRKSYSPSMGMPMITTLTSYNLINSINQHEAARIIDGALHNLIPVKESSSLFYIELKSI